jgi:protein-S-isoprenylcysteine O-methyltransferase Ste14
MMASIPDEQQAVQTLPLRQWIRLLLVYLFIPLILLALGGDLGWWQAWIYGALVVAAGVGGRWWAERRHPGLMAERNQFGKAAGVKPWDKVLAPLMAIGVGFPIQIVAALDHRFSWSPEFSMWLNLLGLVLIAAGYALGTWALAENRFFSGVVRIQTDRGHKVCDSGPYRLVRHPGYAGNILPLPGMALVFGSLWALIPAVLVLVVAVLRTHLEDQALQKELPGYKKYAHRVRYRLVPWIY